MKIILHEGPPKRWHFPPKTSEVPRYFYITQESEKQNLATLSFIKIAWKLAHFLGKKSPFRSRLKIKRKTFRKVPWVSQKKILPEDAWVEENIFSETYQVSAKNSHLVKVWNKFWVLEESLSLIHCPCRLPVTLSLRHKKILRRVVLKINVLINIEILSFLHRH